MNPDLHLHTCYSHGKNSPAEMYASAVAKGLRLMGFSEHSPRPEAYSYVHEYREKLTRHFPDYINEVRTLAAQPDAECKVLLGLEMDWLPDAEDFVRRSCRAEAYDYLIGSVHFLDRWGFDDSSEHWLELSQEDCERLYQKYFAAWLGMIGSGLFNIAAHPDLVKIFSVEQFHIWLQKEEARSLLRTCLGALREQGMAMEISSAGLRKPCAEIYPAPQIMALAAEAGVRISLASDAHNVEHIAYAFPELASYARSFGFREQSVFDHGRHLLFQL